MKHTVITARLGVISGIAPFLWNRYGFDKVFLVIDGVMNASAFDIPYGKHVTAHWLAAKLIERVIAKLMEFEQDRGQFSGASTVPGAVGRPRHAISAFLCAPRIFLQRSDETTTSGLSRRHAEMPTGRSHAMSASNRGSTNIPPVLSG